MATVADSHGGVEVTEEEVLVDRISRMPPPLLEMMHYVWKGGGPTGDEEYVRVRKWRDEDPVGFQRSLLQLETAYQKQMMSANTRDRQIRELIEEIKRLKDQLAEGNNTAPEDEAEERLLRIIDKERKSWNDSQANRGSKGKAEKAVAGNAGHQPGQPL